MCRNGEKCLDYLVTEFDVTTEMLKYILSVFHPTPVNKSGSVKICILFEKVPFIACVVGSKKGRAMQFMLQQCCDFGLDCQVASICLNSYHTIFSN